VAWSITANFTLPGESFVRVAWSTGQLLAGVLLLAAAHAWAIKTVPSIEVRARARGSYTLGGLWRATLSRLPRTRWPVNLLTWGVSLVLCAALIIGGFGWWVTNAKFAPERPKAVQSDPNP
jgi:hypothetical protein